mmetsp:Transcript_6633/g.16533  ORF Transcript_6633/g.16533 Transcript_6633/m.16533 type:complete len:350 (+) Transcript_6633:157-1206(+)
MIRASQTAARAFSRMAGPKHPIAAAAVASAAAAAAVDAVQTQTGRPTLYNAGRRCLSTPPEKSPAIAAENDSNLPAAAQTSKDGVVGLPIDFDVQSKVEGNESQIVTVRLEPGQVLRAESGAMMYMTEHVTINTTTGGGLSEGFKRMLTGQNFFVSDYAYEGPPGTAGTVALGTDFPAKILRLNVEEYGGKLVCQQGALLCCSHTIDIQMEFTKTMTGGFFGGEGFILQALTGTGDVFLKAGGTLIRRDLEEGEELRISSGCLVGFSEGVDYDVQMVKGFTNVVGGGEGLFMTTLTGPGVVWLSGMPPDRMIGEIARRVPSGSGIALGVPIGGGGGGGGGAGTGTGGDQ